jgi:hypothetical protein
MFERVMFDEEAKERPQLLYFKYKSLRVLLFDEVRDTPFVKQEVALEFRRVLLEENKKRTPLPLFDKVIFENKLFEELVT